MSPYAFAFAAAVLWGMAAAMEKSALSHMNPLDAVFMRSVAILIGSTAAMGATGRFVEAAQTPGRWIAVIMAAGVISALAGQYFYFHAMKFAPASKIVPIAGAYPLFAALFAVLFIGERITLQNVFGIVLVVAGVMLVKS
ncbi:MAG: EamA family transporter [bacterium]